MRHVRWGGPLVLALLAGCSSTPMITGEPSASTPTSPSGSPTATASTTTPIATVTPPGSVQPGPTVPLVVGPGDLVLGVPADGLSSVGSYRAQLTTAFAGAEGGQTADWSMTSVVVNGGADAGWHSTVTTSGAGAPAEPVEVWLRNGIAYSAAPGESCSGRQVEGADLLAVTSEPAASLPAVVGAETVGQESVDGVQANHYAFDQRAIGLDGVARAAGELWLAVDGAYLVRYRLTITAGSEYFGSDGQGTLSYDYNLTDVNQPLDVGLPGDCPAGLIDAPVANGATNVLSVPGLLQYDTTASVNDALAYYEDQAGALGWTLIQGPLTSENAGLIEYTTAQGPISILATAGDGATTVSITFGEPTQP
jgi:hypothetical protein